MTTPSQQPSEEDLSTFTRRRNRSVKNGDKLRDKIVNDYRCNRSQEDFFSAFSAKSLKNLVSERPHSVTAKKLLESARCMERGIDALKQNNIVLAASSLAEAIRKNRLGFLARKKNDDIVGLTVESMEALYSDASQENQTRGDALFVHAMLLSSKSNQQRQQALKQYQLAHILLPQDPYILVEEGCLLKSQGDANGALKAFQKAAILCGEAEPEISLFYPATALWSASISKGNYDMNATSLLEKYVQRAEPDALKLPKALYQLATIYGQEGPSSIGKAKHYFALAEESEKRGLPFEQAVINPAMTYLKETTRKLLKNYIACGNEKCSAAAERPCSRCEQVCYCSQECLNADWPSHKVFCKKYRKEKNKKETTR